MELILTDYQYAIKILRKVFQFSFASEKTLNKYLGKESCMFSCVGFSLG